MHIWCSSKRHQLNASKSEIRWFGTRGTVKHLQNTDLRLHVGADSTAPFEMVRDLSVFLDSELTMWQHVGKFASLCYYNLRRLKKVRRILSPTITSRLVSAFVMSRLDYCNALLTGLPQSTVTQLQRVQNSAVRRRDKVSALLTSAATHVTATVHMPNRNRQPFIAKSENALSRTLDLHPGTVCRVTLHQL